MSNWKVYSRLLGYVKPFWFAFALSILGNAVYAGASVLMAHSVEYLEEAIRIPSDSNRIFVCLMIVGVFALRGIGSFAGGYYIAYVGRNIVHRIRTTIFNHFVQLPCNFFDNHSSGHLVSKITFNVEQVTGAASNAITITVREGLTVIGLLGYMIYQNWKLTAIFFLIGPFIGLIISLVSKRFRKLSQRIQNSMGDVTHVASEAINGYKEVRIFGGEHYERERFEGASSYNLKQSLKMEMTKAVSTPVVQILIACAIATLLWVALSPEVHGGMSVGELIAYFTAASTIAKPIRQLTQVNAIIQSGLAAAKDLFSQLDIAAERNTGTVTATAIQGNIEFKDLEFRYSERGKAVLNKLNFKIEAGQTVALVGRSGSGKSTLASLLPRFYEATGGEILIDGVRVQDYELSSLRSQIALVTQNVTLFNDSIARNIAYGRLDDRSEQEIKEAAEKAYALEFIRQYDHGLNTEIGDNGVLLSGGQRQRLAIARAFLKDAPILIMDEATSALDNEAEKEIQKVMETVMQGRTTLVIAHRLSTIESADVILVMEEGQIIEAGSHRDLLEQGGAYYRLHQTQFCEG
nr:lipid A export permease/ATP-binding protein MsbA [Oleiphilus messinensis]